MTVDHLDPEYLSYVTLMFLGDDLIPSEVSTVLRLRPTKSWARGEPRGASPSVHDWGGWKKSLPESRLSHSFPSQLHFWVRTLRGKEDQLLSLSEAGYLCALNCYVGSRATASIILSPKLQRAVAAIGLELRMSFFAHENAA
jgi:hypothetical protein